MNGGYRIILVIATDQEEATIIGEFNSLPVLDYKDDAFRSASTLKTITLPSEYRFYTEHTFATLPYLEAILIENSDYFTSVDGVLYSKDLSELVFYPRAKLGETYEIPEGTVSIRSYAFENNPIIKNVVIPSTVTVIGDSIFNGTRLDEVEFRQTNTVYFISSKIFDAENETIIIYVDDSRLDYFKTVSPLKNYEIKVISEKTE